MTGLIGALRISLGMGTATFETDAKRAGKTVDVLGDRAEKMGFAVGRATKNLIGLGQVLVGSAVLGGLTTAIKRSLDFAASLGETAQQVGTTVRELQVYRYAAEQAGAAEEEMDTALAKLNATLGQAALGAKKPGEMFAALGINIRDANGHVKTSGQIFPEVVEALSKMSSSAERDAVAKALMGKSAQKLNGIIADGKQGLDDYAKRADASGRILSDELAASADNAADKMEDLNQQMKVSFAKEVAANADSILGLANALFQLTSQAVQFINKQPQLTGALAGAAVGWRMAGPLGAAGGAVGGAVLGQKAQQSAEDANMDLAFRTRKLSAATARAENAMKFYPKQPQESWAQRWGITPSRRGWFGDRQSSGEYDAAKADLAKQRQLMAQARARSPSPNVVAPTPVDEIDMPEVFGGGGGGGGRKRGGDPAKEAERLREEAIRRQQGFDSEVADLDADLLDAKRDNTNDYKLIAQFARQQVEAEADKARSEIEAKRQLGDYTDLQAQQLTAKVNEVELQRIVNINAEENAQAAADAAALAAAQLDNQRDLIQSQAHLALTAKDRRDLALRLLDLDKQEERARLEAVIAARDSTEVEKAIARERLKQLDAIYQGRASAANDNNRSPLEEWAKRKQRTPEQMRERAEELVVDRLDQIERGMAQGLAEKVGMGDDPLITGLFEMLLDEILFRPLADAIRGGRDGMGGGNGLFGGGGLLGGLFDAIFGGIFGFAQGTPSAPRGWAMVGEEGPELVRFNGGEQIYPNGYGPGGGGGGNVYQISGNLLTPEFWAQIQRMDAQAAQAGSAIAQRDMAWRSSRTIGGR